MRIRAKICGITRVEDALAAVKHGADAVGLVFYEKSPRNVGVEQAAEIIAALPAFITAVGLFVNEEADRVDAIRRRVGLNLLQFHGDESPTYCQAFDFPYVKAVRVRPGLNLIQYAADFSTARGLLLDAYQEGVPGGTGKTFDWDLIPSNLPKPVILAGGLDPENIGEAIRRVHPYAVDVSGGVEREKGIKDAAKIAAFMRGVLDAEV